MFYNMHAYLFISNIFTIKTYRRFHGKQSYCLEYMTVYYIADDAITIKIPAQMEKKNIKQYPIGYPR
jgi:hypothetical protein